MEVPWTVERIIGIEETLKLEQCGPDFLLVGSALWDTSNWLGSVEQERCGMTGASGGFFFLVILLLVFCFVALGLVMGRVGETVAASI